MAFRFDIDNVYVIIKVRMVRPHEYLDASGRNEYGTWFNGLDDAAATKVTVALERLAGGKRVVD